MNILVTGASGFIGKHVCDFLKQQGHSLVKVEIGGRGNAKSDITVDLTDDSAVKRVFEKFAKDNPIDVVIHLAGAMADPKHDRSGQFEVLIDNIKMAKSVVFICEVLKPRKLINFSSMAVYPNKDGVFDETSAVDMSENGDCLYGLSKFCNEKIFDHFLKEQNITISHLRISQVYGEGMRQDRIIPVMKKELQEKNTITVFGDGERLSNFINIDKLSGILKYFITEEIGGIYNVGDECLSYLELAKLIIKDHGNKQSRIIKLKQGSRTKFDLDIGKLEKVINKIKKG